MHFDGNSMSVGKWIFGLCNFIGRVQTYLCYKMYLLKNALVLKILPFRAEKWQSEYLVEFLRSALCFAGRNKKKKFFSLLI